MKKIILNPYTVDIPQPDGTTRKVSYDVKKSIELIMLAAGDMTSQRLSMVDLLRNAKVADKILQQDGNILLEDSEYALVKQSFDAFKGFGKNEVELCKRVSEAETVKVEEKKKK